MFSSFVVCVVYENASCGLSRIRIGKCQFLTLIKSILTTVKERLIMNRFSIANNNVLFSALLAFAPVIFGAMFLGSGSFLAAISAVIAYLSLVIGERLEV